MFDIQFYAKFYEFRKQCKENPASLPPEKDRPEFLLSMLESFRSKEPIVYNIETTNACNMHCAMCPRTTMMTRTIKQMGIELFSQLAEQLRPFTTEEWSAWKAFIVKTYGIHEYDMSENHFFLYIIPQVIQLHGYGDPLLDINMCIHVKRLYNKGFKSYFSCNPANIDLEKTYKILDSGLNYVKYSLESVDDKEHKKIRGRASNFSKSYANILKVLNYKEVHKLDTVIIITMIDLNRDIQTEDFERLRHAFAGKNVYIYLKSEDQQWYRKNFHPTKSIHWNEECKHPWMSMTIKSDGAVAMCMEDFNNEIILGDAKKTSLRDIWNSSAYAHLRRDHIILNDTIKCTQRCDMALVGRT